MDNTMLFLWKRYPVKMNEGLNGGLKSLLAVISQNPGINTRLIVCTQRTFNFVSNMVSWGLGLFNCVFGYILEFQYLLDVVPSFFL